MDILKAALYDAIDWRGSLLDASRGFDPKQDERNEALLAAYRAELKRRTKNDVVTPEPKYTVVALKDVVCNDKLWKGK